MPSYFRKKAVTLVSAGTRRSDCASPKNSCRRRQRQRISGRDHFAPSSPLNTTWQPVADRTCHLSHTKSARLRLHVFACSQCHRELRLGVIMPTPRKYALPRGLFRLGGVRVSHEVPPLAPSRNVRLGALREEVEPSNCHCSRNGWTFALALAPQTRLDLHVGLGDK